MVSGSTNPIGRLRRPGLSVEPLELERETVLVLRGEFDLTGIEVFEQAVASVTPRDSLVLDLRELTFMDSTGLRALAQTNARSDEAGFALSIVRGSRQIERVLEISGLADLLPLVDAPPAEADGAPAP